MMTSEALRRRSNGLFTKSPDVALDRGSAAIVDHHWDFALLPVGCVPTLPRGRSSQTGTMPDRLRAIDIYRSNDQS